MAFYEERAVRNGVAMPIQCIDIRVRKNRNHTNLHYHDYTELLFTLEGHAHVYIGGECFILPEGAMIIVHNGEPHDVICPDCECRYIVIKFLPQILRTEEETFSEYSYTSLLMENAPDKQIFFSAAELKDTALPGLFMHMMEEWEAQIFGYELSLRADVTQIYLFILRQWWNGNLSLVENIELAGQGEFIRKAVSYIGEHYADLTESMTAAACGMSTAYFSRLFKRIMKVSFSTYLSNVRLKEAERLLLLTDRSITDIAQTVGFSTASYFISLFRKERNMTPYQYRRNHRK